MEQQKFAFPDSTNSIVISSIVDVPGLDSNSDEIDDNNDDQRNRKQSFDDLDGLEMNSNDDGPKQETFEIITDDGLQMNSNIEQAILSMKYQLGKTQ